MGKQAIVDKHTKTGFPEPLQPPLAGLGGRADVFRCGDIIHEFQISFAVLSDGAINKRTCWNGNI
jgi:hypothetical protein